MAANNINRQTVREAVASLLETEMTGAGNPVQTVYEYRKDFAPESPVILVLSAGSDRQKTITFDGAMKTDVRLEVLFFVLDADDNIGWTEQEADDRLDLVEKEFSDVLNDNFRILDKRRLVPEEGFSEIFNVVIGGKAYLMEQQFLLVQG